MSQTTLATTSRPEPTDHAQPGHFERLGAGRVTTSTSDAAATTTVSSSSTTSDSGVLSGSCSQVGYWYCNGGTAFQRWADGEWDASQGVAEGTECTAGIPEILTISASKRRREVGHMRGHGVRPNLAQMSEGSPSETCPKKTFFKGLSVVGVKPRSLGFIEILADSDSLPRR